MFVKVGQICSQGRGGSWDLEEEATWGEGMSLGELAQARREGGH